MIIGNVYLSLCRELQDGQRNAVKGFTLDTFDDMSNLRGLSHYASEFMTPASSS